MSCRDNLAEIPSTGCSNQSFEETTCWKQQLGVHQIRQAVYKTGLVMTSVRQHVSFRCKRMVSCKNIAPALWLVNGASLAAKFLMLKNPQSTDIITSVFTVGKVCQVTRADMVNNLCPFHLFAIACSKWNLLTDVETKGILPRIIRLVWRQRTHAPEPVSPSTR